MKAYSGSPGILEVPRRARGRLEAWRKWTFPTRRVSRGADAPAWKPVRKRRRISRFSSGSGWAPAGARELGEQPQCEVELTDIYAAGEIWWTLGFEATGPGDLLAGELEAAADLVFARALPGLQPTSCNLGPTRSGCPNRLRRTEELRRPVCLRRSSAIFPASSDPADPTADDLPEA